MGQESKAAAAAHTSSTRKLSPELPSSRTFLSQELRSGVVMYRIQAQLEPVTSELKDPGAGFPKTIKALEPPVTAERC